MIILNDFIIKRFAQGLLLIFIVSIVVFSLLYLMPGDPVDTMIGDRGVSEERKAEIKSKWGLDKSLYVQYYTWIANVCKLDFGTSITTRQPVIDILVQRLPVTIKLCGIALIIELLISIPLGMYTAYRKDGIFDRVILAITSVFRAIPPFWLAIIMILIFGVKYKLLPLSGFKGIKNFVMPVSAIALTNMAGSVRMMRTEALEVFNEKYVQTAYAKGLTKGTVIIKHVLRNALIVVTVQVFMAIPWIISGSVIIENIFVIPGIGSILTKSILAQDFPVVQACILIISILTVLCNILSDIFTALLDPRIRV